MYIIKNFSFKGIMSFGGFHLIWLTPWVIIVACIYKFLGVTWIAIPWTAVSLIGTAVSFYIGFKNNQAYDRLWEARKIWGGIINNSRSFGTNLKAYVGNQFRNNDLLPQSELDAAIKKIIYRHIAWLYALRGQLLVPAPWEHLSQGHRVGELAAKRMKIWGIGIFDEKITENNIKAHLSIEEYNTIIKLSNPATQIIDIQSQELAKHRAKNVIDDFRQMELQKILNNFLDEQGKAERIKKFPLPRQYGSFSFIFITIFIFLLPLGLIAEFDKLGSWGIWASIPIISIVGWVFLMMELIGDYSENPFEGLGNDIPMLSLCRTIEIDLKEMIRDVHVPKPIEVHNGVLM